MRHTFLLQYIPMATGNYYITFLTFILSYFYATWMFRSIERINRRLTEEQSRRAVYEERERLAGELHDSIAQTLFYLNVKLQQGQMEEARFAVSDMDQQVRQAIFNLRSLPEEGVSLKQRLSKWLKEWSTLTGIEIIPEIDIPPAYFSSGDEVQLFGIVQEAFTNIRKHAGAKKVQIIFTILADGWRLWIADDGIGMMVDMNPTKKYGISMIKQRAAAIGATFDICNREKGGLEICLASHARESKFG
ncbi:MAG TPA: two-component sensor histidine kinase [Pelotomaculum sp.]|nr:two-component sensor histidine kinase [Pelotomaculum sp.]